MEPIILAKIFQNICIQKQKQKQNHKHRYAAEFVRVRACALFIFEAKLVIIEHLSHVGVVFE